MLEKMWHGNGILADEILFHTQVGQREGGGEEGKERGSEERDYKPLNTASNDILT